MGDEMLAGVCELAFDVAKEGGAPSVMKNYLYLAQRPPRAYSVAQRALEEDPGFRERVAQRATIGSVGEAGYLWLHRPDGWEQRFVALEAGIAPIAVEGMPATPLAERPPMPTPPSPGTARADSVPPMPAPPSPGAPLPPEARAAVPSSDTTSSARLSASGARDEIEGELADLRSLVDRLADERKNVRSSVSELEVELEQRRAENQQMSNQLSNLRRELDTVHSAEATVLLERDSAVARVADLEAEVTKLTTEIERLAAAAEGSASEHEAALTDLAVIGGDRDRLRAELDQLDTTHRQTLADLATARSQRDRLAEIEADRDRLQGELDAVVTDRNSLSGQFNGLRSERDSVLAERDQLRERFEATRSERDELLAQRDGFIAQHGVATERLAEVDQLRADNTELARRLAVAEKARVDLEGQLEEVSLKWQSASRQMAVFEGVNRQLDDAIAERKTMEAQLRQANGALAELHRRIGSSHDQIRSELTTIESAFGAAPVASTHRNDDDPAADAAASSAGADRAGASVVDASQSDHVDTDVVDDSHAPAFGEEGLDVPADLATDDFVVDGGVVDGGVVDGRDDNYGDDKYGDDKYGDDKYGDDEYGDDAAMFDPTGLELDPDALGGRTIGDMFGTDRSDNDQDVASIAASPDVDGSATTASVSESDPRFDRRRIAVPSALDLTAAARHIASTPDVILLVDGDGVAGVGWPHLDVAARRSALVGYLGTLTAQTGAAADVVFERPIGGEEALPVSRAVRVRIADEPIAGRSLFDSIIGGYPSDWPIAIVTNEATLVDRAEELQVSLLSNDQLLDLFLDLSSEG